MTVPLPDFASRTGKAVVFDLGDDRHRRFLTDNLPAPTSAVSGLIGTCSYCDRRVNIVRVTTHVKGAKMVSANGPHDCRRRKAVA